MPLSQRVLDVERIAAGQWNVFSHAQARRSGVTKEMIAHHCRLGGRWERAEPRVTRVKANTVAWQQPLMAAQLSLRDLAPLSHRAAAAVLGLDGVDVATVRPEFTLPRCGRHDRWVIHRREVRPGELASTGPLVHTRALRTLCDLPAVLDDNGVELAVEAALRHGLVEEGALVEAGATAANPGAPALRRVVQRRGEGSPPTESALETLAVQCLRREPDLPPPARQVVVAVAGGKTFRLDLAWPDRKLFIEIDGRAWHDIDDDAFHYERWRQNQLLLLGWSALRLTARDLRTRPAATAQMVRQVWASTRLLRIG